MAVDKKPNTPTTYDWSVDPYGSYYQAMREVDQQSTIPDLSIIMSEFRKTITDFRNKSEDWWFISYWFETNQVFEINDQVKLTQKISNDRKISGTGQCSVNGKLTVAHFMQTQYPLPLANTKVLLEPGKYVDQPLRGGILYGYNEGQKMWQATPGAETLSDTTNQDGIVEFDNCTPNQPYRVTFLPEVTTEEIDKLYESYEPILQHCAQWLLEQWGADKIQAQTTVNTLFASKNPDPQQMKALFESLDSKITGGFKQRWQEFSALSYEKQQAALLTNFISGIWDAIKSTLEALFNVVQLFMDIKKNYQKIKKILGEITQEEIKAKANKIIIFLNDKGLLFILFTTFIQWITILPPQDTAHLAGKVICELAINIVVGIILTRGAGLAFRVGGELIKTAGTGSKAFVAKSLAKLTELFTEMADSAKFKKLIDLHFGIAEKIALPSVTTAIASANTFKYAEKTYENTILLARKVQKDLATIVEKKRKGQNKRHDEASHNKNNDKSRTNTCTVTGGCPVSMVTGEELLSLTDGTLNGLLNFEWKRLYRTSAAEENKGLGFGWGHSLSQSLIIDGDKVHWTSDENITTTLPLPTKKIPTGINNLAEAGIFLGKDDSELIIAQADGQGFYHFKQTKTGAQLEAISDKYNNRIYINRDITGKIHRVHNGAGRGLMFRYHARHIIGVDYQQEVAGDTYEQSWKTLQTIASYEYNAQGQLIKATNAAGESERYRYDQLNVIQERIMAGGAAFYWEWEGQGKQVRAIKHWSNYGQHQTYQWDDNGTVLVINEDGSQQTYTHDQNAKLIKQINPDGAEIQKDYNETGNLIAERSPTGAETLYQYDQDDQLRLVTAPDGNITQYGYDNGHVNRIIQGDAQWLYERNPQGDITQQTDPQGNITHYQYTETGKIKIIHYPDGSQHLLTWNKLGQLIEETLPQGGTRRYRYDSLGNQIIRQDERNQVTQFTYDAIGRLSSVSYPDKTTKQFKYNAYSNITESIDEQGRITRYQYLPNLHKVSAKINPDGSQVQYQYNSQLNLTGITNEQGERYHLDYYPNGLISQEIGFDGRKTSYQYDLGGNLIAKTDYDDQGKEYTTTYLRSPMGKLLQKTLPDGKQIKYSYNGQGLLTSVDDEQWPLNYEYDITGKLTAEHQGWATLRYQYSPLGILSQCKLPDGNVIDYKYQKGGQLAQINLNDQKLTEHFYSLGQEVERQQGSLTSQYDYDEQGRLKTHFVNNSQKNLYQRKYQYSANGNLAAIEDSRKGIRQYHYDPLDRLVQVRGDISEDLIHDPAGNLLAQDHKTQQTNVKGNRLLMQGDKHFTYDSFGNLIQEARGKSQQLITNYQYDSQQQLIQATTPDGTSASYQYDAFGRRISKTVTDKTGQKTKTEFIWIGEKIVAESSKGHYQTYLYEPDTYKPLALLKGKGKKAEIYYYQLDHLGTPLELTAANGAIAWSAKYKAYGNLAVLEVNELEQPLRFQGQYHDLETDLYYNRFRYYNPEIGRYITPDPIKLAGGLNNYQYVKNPTGWVDPLGLNGIDTCPKTVNIKKGQLTPEDKARAEKLRADSEKNGVTMRAHEAEVAVEYEKAMGVELAPAPNGANYDFIITKANDPALVGKRVDFMYTLDDQKAIDMMNLYLIKGKPSKQDIKAGLAKKDPKTGAYYSDDPALAKIQVDKMKENIDKHVNDNKADIAPMDLRNFNLENKQAIKDYVNTLPADKRSKIQYIED